MSGCWPSDSPATWRGLLAAGDAFGLPVYARRRTPELVGRTAGVVALLVVMVVLIVGLDVLFLRDRFGLRLAVNIGIVVVALVIYLAFLRR